MRETGAGGIRFGSLSLGFLAVTVASGIALSALFRPEAALESVEAIQSGLPWAWGIRGLHAWAALGFLLCAGIHLVDVIRAGALDRVPAGAWWRAVGVVPLAVAGMLTGFLLRGDAEAQAAMQVGRGVIGSIPLVGDGLATLLLGPAGAGLGAVTLHHAGTFTILPWLLSIEHGRRTWPDRQSWVATLLVAGTAAAIVPVPLGPFDGTGARLQGPWYLQGLQGMLLDLPVATAWIVPAAFVAGVGALVHVRGRARTVVVAGLAVLAVAWVGWTVRLWIAGAP
jgi:hypothetical protein